MSIRKKILIFGSAILIVPMLVILFLSYSVLNKQIEKAAQEYLQNASIIARNEMINRLNEIQKLTTQTSRSPEFKKAVRQSNEPALNEISGAIHQVYDYIDFWMIVDGQKTLIFSRPNEKKTLSPRLNALIGQAETARKAITSEEVLDLDELFAVGSKAYNQFKVRISPQDRSNGKNRFLTKCLASIAIAPIYDRGNAQRMGFLIVGCITNNDDYLPKVYSKSVKDSYLAISIDNTRITSNIRSPQKDNYIGSPSPITINTLEGMRSVYYGKQNNGGEIHIFVDTPILNRAGKHVGILGVGIPEHKFSVIMNIQRNIVVCVALFCLVIMIFIGRYAANRISEPIMKAAELAGQIAQGNTEVSIEKRFFDGKNSETSILLQSFQKMACDLKKSEAERADYLEKLQNEQIEQQKLSQQLALLNVSLEEKIQLRTQDLREAVISLQKSGEVKSLFLANMSHELKTPLSAIIDYSKLLKDEIFGSLNDKQQEYVQNILGNGNHLLRLINDILDLSKIEAGKMSLTLGRYSMANIIEESFSMVRSFAERKKIAVTILIKPHDFIVKVDANKLKQVLCNLLSNAIKFTLRNGKVMVKAFKNENYLYIIVKDNGIGIKEEDQKRIFNEFEQVDSSYEREYGGTGLGLPLAKKLVELHGGKILLTSQIGAGTEVIVTLFTNSDENMDSAS